MSLQEAVEDGLEQYGVLIFRNQDITPEEQVAWSRALGPLALTQRVSARLPHLPEIFIVGNTIAPPVTFSPKTEQDDLEWHADHIHHGDTLLLMPGAGNTTHEQVLRGLDILGKKVIPKFKEAAI